MGFVESVRGLRGRFLRSLRFWHRTFRDVSGGTWTGPSNLLLHIFTAGVTEHLSSTRGIGDASGNFHHLCACASRVGSVVKITLQTSRRHLLEANYEDTIGTSMANDISSHMQACRTGRTVVVDVVDWDLGHAKLVENSLAAGGVSVAVACHTLVDIVVIDLSIKHSLDTSLETKFGVINLASGLDELGHAHAENVAWLVAFDNHFECFKIKEVGRGIRY